MIISSFCRWGHLSAEIKACILYIVNVVVCLIVMILCVKLVNYSAWSIIYSVDWFATLLLIKLGLWTIWFIVSWATCILLLTPLTY